MDPIQVNAVLLRGLLPDLPMTTGTRLMGRVLERHGAHGLLNLGGAVLVAQLPEGVEEGARLRLQVAGADGDQLVLRVLGDAPPAGPAQQAPPQTAGTTPPGTPLPLPGDVIARVRVDGEDEDGPGGAGRTKAVTVRYDSPALGRLEVRLVLSPAGLVAGVAAPAGVALDLAGDHAGELRAALASAMGTSVDVHVGARKDRVDVRA